MQDIFATMPFTGLVGGRILCMHGGLSPKLKNLDQLRHIVRPVDPPNPSLHMDLLWSDPDTSIKVTKWKHLQQVLGVASEQSRSVLCVWPRCGRRYYRLPRY